MNPSFRPMMKPCCLLCGNEIDDLSLASQIPPFDPFNPVLLAEGKDYRDAPLKLVHRTCWNGWRNRDEVLELAIQGKNADYTDADFHVVGRGVGVWCYLRKEVRFSFGELFLGNSSIVFQNLCGPDVRCCEIRSASTDLLFLLELITSRQVNSLGKFVSPSSSFSIAVTAIADDSFVWHVNTGQQFGNFTCEVSKVDVEACHEMLRGQPLPTQY